MPVRSNCKQIGGVKNYSKATTRGWFLPTKKAAQGGFTKFLHDQL